MGTHKGRDPGGYVGLLREECDITLRVNASGKIRDDVRGLCVVT